MGWRTEVILILLTGLAVAWSSYISPYYLSADQILYSLQQSVGVAGLLACGMFAVIVVGEIDISLPAIMALANMVFAQLAIAEAPIAVALPAVLVLGTLAGLLNGALVVAFGLPSLAVTLGALGAYRALALWLGGQESFAAFPEGYTWVGFALVGEIVPVSLLLLGAVLLALGILMHQTVFGRLCYTIGNNAKAAHFSGARVGLVKIAAFGLGGCLSGLASLVYIGQFQSARADNASDMLLFIVTAVVLGGVDIFGGRGRVIGVALALVLLGTLKNGMGLVNVAGPMQTLMIGSLLIIAVLIGQLDRLRATLLRRPASS
jgi:rhamnose transport system permease protein